MPSDSFDPFKDVEKKSTVINKDVVLQQLIQIIRANLETLVASRDKTREMAIDAPGANQSHSDTSKFQLSNVRLGLESLRIETDNNASQLSRMKIESCSRVTLGAIFSLHETSGGSQDKYYFLVPAGGGESISIGDMTITSITPGTPIAKACLRKEEGDVVGFNGKEFEISKII